MTPIDLYLPVKEPSLELNPLIADPLRKLMGLIYTEAFYDCMNDSTARYAKSLYPHIKELNDLLHFKR